MIECESIAEARKVENLIHIEAGRPVKAWQKGDTLPSHLLPDPPTPEEAAQQAVDGDKVIKAVIIRQMEVRLGRLPTSAELRAERDRIARIYENL